MPQYILGVMHDTDYGNVDFDNPDAETLRMMTQVGAFNDELQRAGAWVFGAGLGTAANATVVRNTAGTVSMTDGPFAESKEQMGGFYIIEATDLDAALEWAGRASAACERPIEVRPADGG